MNETQAIAKYGQRIKNMAAKRAAKVRGFSILDEGDLENVALMALVKSARKYEPSLFASFWTYAYPRVTGSMIDHIRANSPIKNGARTGRQQPKFVRYTPLGVDGRNRAGVVF